MNLELVVRELARFLNIPYEKCMERVCAYSTKEAADKWRKESPKTPKEVEEFYKNAEHYLYELVSWNCVSPVYQEWNRPLLNNHGKKILELGGGIGTLCIQLAYAGNEVTYCDISPRLRDFVKQRVEERGLKNITIIDTLKGQKDFDIVVANDFFEHIHPDILPKMLKEISSCLKDQGFVYHRSNFKQQDVFPMHYDHSENFPNWAKDANLIERPNGDLVKGIQTKGVHVGLPCLGDIPDAWFHSWITLEKEVGVKFSKVSNRPVDEARNDIIRASDRDWIFFMDSDQTFHPKTLQKLLSWNLPIVSGLYFKTPGEPTPHCYKYVCEKDKSGMYRPITDQIVQFLSKHRNLIKSRIDMVLPSMEEDLIECDGIGGGCLLIHKRVLDAIGDPWFKCNEGATFGEDFYFCRKAQAAGFKIYVDPGVICGHRAKGFIGAEHFLSYTTSQEKNLDLTGVYPYPWNKF